jgi:anti-sigma factor RsiW
MTTSSAQDDSRLLLHAYLDGELDPVHAVEMERQLAADPALTGERDRIVALRQLIGERALLEAMPQDLADRIEHTLGLRQQRARSSWQALAAAAILAAAVASGATWLVLRAASTESPPNLVVASHLRALMAPQPTDVSSSDRHTVRPWFSGRIPESPRVVDLTDKGFPLVGGRIDVIGTQPVPTLVYRHRQHLISLMAVPVANLTPAAERQTIAGYNVQSWRDQNTGYWVVSDLGISDLNAFATAFRAAAQEK